MALTTSSWTKAPFTFAVMALSSMKAPVLRCSADELQPAVKAIPAEPRRRVAQNRIFFMVVGMGGGESATVAPQRTCRPAGEQSSRVLSCAPEKSPGVFSRAHERTYRPG